jgi:hypothetical protein
VTLAQDFSPGLAVRGEQLRAGGTIESGLYTNRIDASGGRHTQSL